MSQGTRCKNGTVLFSAKIDKNNNNVYGKSNFIPAPAEIPSESGKKYLTPERVFPKIMK